MRPTRPQIDWSRVAARLDEARSALERALDPPPERVREVWRQRAAALAARAPTVRRGAGEPVLAFALNEERLAFPLPLLAEVLPAVAPAPLPGAPAEVLGLLGRRGAVLPILDLGGLLGLPRSAAPTEGYLLVLRDRSLALRVDRLEGVRRLLPGDLQPATGSPFLRGRAADGTAVLDVPALLAHPLLEDDEEGA